MTKINQFKRKGGVILWIEGVGHQAAYCGEPKQMLINPKTREVYRATKEELRSPPEHFVRCKVFL